MVSKADLEAVAKQAATETLRGHLTALGIDASDPFEAQKDFQALREMRKLFSDGEIQKDFIHLRQWRLRMEKVRTKGLLTAVGIVTAGIVAAVWTGLTASLTGGHPPPH
jgi:hypothetical protein